MGVCSLASKSLPETSILHTWKPTILSATENGGNAADVIDWMREEIEDAGFVNLHDLDFNIPTGDWPQHPVWKEAGRLGMIHFKVRPPIPNSLSAILSSCVNSLAGRICRLGNLGSGEVRSSSALVSSRDRGLACNAQ